VSVAKKQPDKQTLVVEMRKSINVLHDHEPQLTSIAKRFLGLLEAQVILLEMKYDLLKKEKHDV
jgi:hypothetical protein